MSENEKNNGTSGTPAWEEVLVGVNKMMKDNAQASEIIAQKTRESKSKNLGLIALMVVSLFLIMHSYNQSQIMYENDKEWRQVVEQNNQRWIDYLSQYDFVSQDGDGINNINTGEQGDIVNGAESEAIEEPE